MARYLVVANITGESPSLRMEVTKVMRRDRAADFVVLVPVCPIPALLEFVVGMGRRPILLARRRAQRARRRLESTGARCIAVRTGASDPLRAIEDELRYEDFRGVIISTLPHPISHWLRIDLPGKVARLHPELEVRHVVAPRELYLDDADISGEPQALRV